MDIAYLGIFIGALLLSSVLTYRVRNTALRKGWTCRPANERDIHRSPVPRLGGVPIFLSFLIVLSVFLAAGGGKGLVSDVSTLARTLISIVVPASLMFLLGLIDDFWPIPARIKFAIQVVIAVLVYVGGVQISAVPLLFGYKVLGTLITLPLTVLWILWISNAFNLIDGLDGLSAGSALFSTTVVFIVSIIAHNTFVSVLTVILAGAILGFLRYNLNPATVFLGDCGSLFLGFMLSAVALVGAQKGATLVAVSTPIIAFGLPILDVGLSIVRRYLSGQPLFRADREHIHHKLLKLGFTQPQVLAILYAVCAVFGLLSLLLLYPTGALTGVVLGVVAIGVVFGVQYLRYPEFAELGRTAKRTIHQTRMIVNNLALRRASDELARCDDFDAICSTLQSAFQENDFDGFEFQIESVLRPADLTSRFFEDLDGRWIFAWNRSNSTKTGMDNWSMKLDLKGSMYGRRGLFTIHRRYEGKALLVDINLLISDFRASLADAMERAQMKAIRQRLTTSSNIPVGAPASALTGD